MAGPAGSRARLGRLAAWIRDARIPLELCPSSNVQTGAAAAIVAEHPIDAAQGPALPGDGQHRQPADVGDVDVAGRCAAGRGGRLDAGGSRWVTINALKSAFIPFDERLALIEDVVKPGYGALGVPA